MVRFQSYVICTSPRSGSTLLCKLLDATDQSGKPNSHFHRPSIAAWLSTYQLSANEFDTERDTLRGIFQAARERGTGNTGIFGLRLQGHSFPFFMEKLRVLHPGFSSDREMFQAAFGETLFIHLTRSNKIDQAISLVKANQSGLWHKSSDGTELERSAAPQELIYDSKEIAKRIAELTILDDAWKDWFAKENLEPLQISYDQLSAEPSQELARILDRLGLDRNSALDIVPPVAKLADATNRTWAERFAAEIHDRPGQNS